MSSDSRRANESGIVILGIMILMVFVLIGMVFVYVKHAQDKKSVSTTAAEAVSAGSTAIARSAENVQRKNDASLVLSATAAYMASSGFYPVSLSKGMLQGMGHYTSAAIVSGNQDPVTTDDLRLVTRAACTSGGRAVAVSSAGSYVAQFSLANADGSFTPQCLAT